MVYTSGIRPMRRLTAFVFGLTTVAGALMLVPGMAVGQERVVFKTGIGFAAPVGALAGRQEFGPTLGAELGYRISDRLVLKAMSDIDLLEGTFISRVDRSAGMQLLHLGIGAEVRVASSALYGYQFSGELGTGRTRLRTVGLDGYAVVDGPIDHSCFSTFGGMSLTSKPSRRATAYVRGRIRWMMANSGRTEPLAGQRRIGSAFVVPFTVGMKLRL